MTPSDKIALVAALAAVVSAIVGVGAFLAAWRSGQESRKSAGAAQKSAEAAVKSNELMARQIEVTVNDQDRRQKKERADSQPFFVWRDGKYGGMYCEANFQNAGGDASDLSVKTDVSDIGISINPQDLIPKSGMGKVIFRKGGQVGSLPIRFTISGKTKLGENWGKSFQLKEWSTITVTEA